MKRATLLLAIAALAGCSERHARNDSRASTLPAASESTSSDPAVVRSAFLKRLRLLADKGDLFEPESLAPILGMNLEASTIPTARTPASCGDGTVSGGRVTTVAPQNLSWFRTLPSGAGNMNIPAYTINPATTSGDPEIEYRIYHSVYCRDWPRMRDHKEANLWFTGLPAFTCLTPADIQVEIPEARLRMATDGVSIVGFEGRVDDEAAVTVQFIYRAGVRCALSAQLNQDQENGLRYRRAVYKYEVCRAPSDREFCSTHPDVTWPDREMLRQLYQQAYDRCGTPDSFYVKEAATGEAPLPLPPRNRTTSPCDGG